MTLYIRAKAEQRACNESGAQVVRIKKPECDGRAGGLFEQHQHVHIYSTRILYILYTRIVYIYKRSECCIELRRGLRMLGARFIHV